MQHFDDDTRSEMKHVRALIEVNKCVCVLYVVYMGGPKNSRNC